MSRGLRWQSERGDGATIETLDRKTNESQNLREISNAFFELRNSDLFGISIGACLTNYLTI